MLGPSGAVAPKRAAIVVAPRIDELQIAVIVSGSIGDYRSGDEIWCDTLQPEAMQKRSTATCSSPVQPGAYLFGRLINRDEDKLQILPLESGGRQQVVANPPWLAVATRLVRSL